MSIPENNPGALANGQKQNNPANGSGKSNNGCEHRYCVMTGKSVSDKNVVYYHYRCTEQMHGMRL